MRRVRLWLARLLLRDELAQIEREVEEEFRFHLDMKTASLVAGGMDPEEARKAAARSFGDEPHLKEVATRDLSDIRVRERGARRLDWMGQDLKDGIRQLYRRPGFALLAVAMLALGLSTSTAVFTYVNAYTRPFPGAESPGLFQVYLSRDDDPFGEVSFPDYEDLARLSGDALGLAAVGRSVFAASVRFDELTEVAFGEAVTGDFFSLAGVDMALGRGLSPLDDRPESPPAVVISHAYWGERYASDPDVLGKTILLNNNPYTIVGVTGPSFLGSTAASRPAFWLPFEQYMRVYWARSDARRNRDLGTVTPLARLRGGTTAAGAAEILDGLAEGLDAEAPLQDGTRRFVLRPATWISPATRVSEASTTRIMMTAAVCLLLLACANVGNLVLSAGTRRHREMALRSAMGASRLRLVRQLLAESLVLSTAAGGLALLAAGPVSARLSSYFARPSVWGTDVPRVMVVDPRVLGFALLLAVLTAVVTGLAPALRVASRNPADALSDGSAGSHRGRRGSVRRIPGTRDLLVSAQIALSVVLLFVAGLVLRTLNAARDVDAGFDTQQTLASYVSTSSMGVPVEARHRFFEELIRRFEDLPWVERATVAEAAPLSGHPTHELRVGQGSDPIGTTVARVWPGYFDVMGMEILRGRSLEDTDTVAATGVVVMNESLARRVAADGDALGQILQWPGADGDPGREYEVVGVVRDARQVTLLDEPGPVAYFSLPQHYSAPGNALLVRVAGNPAAAVGRMERELRQIDTRIAVVNILPYHQVVRGFLYKQRMNAEMFGVIALLGLVLAAAGVFGVVALAVARSRREIGIRVAVGADRVFIVRMVLGTVSGPLALGLALGLAGALVATRLVGGLLWGVAPTDPFALIAGGAVLLAAVAVAVAVPVSRALHVDPVASLRTE